MNTKNFYDKAQAFLDETYTTLDEALKDAYLKAEKVLDAIYDLSESDSEKPEAPSETYEQAATRVKIEKLIAALKDKSENDYATESWQEIIDSGDYKDPDKGTWSIGHLDNLICRYVH